MSKHGMATYSTLGIMIEFAGASVLDERKLGHVVCCKSTIAYPATKGQFLEV
jgi:hypothetical protein